MDCHRKCSEFQSSCDRAVHHFRCRAVRAVMVVLPLLVVMPLAVGNAFAQTSAYPDKPIRLLVPFAPGGGADIVARVIAQRMSEALRQQVIVDNRGGAGGTIGAEMAVRAKPDGYTLILGSATYAISPSLYKVPYDVVHNITPVAQIASGSFVVLVHPSVPAKNINELIALAKAKPNALQYATAGIGSITHLATELFDMMTGVSMKHIPYKGNGPALTDLLGGQVQVAFFTTPNVGSNVETGRLRALAVTTSKRLAMMPDVPTVAESGVPNYEVMTWYAIWGPKNLPENIVNRWNREINRIIQSKELIDRFAQEGLVPTPGTPEDFLKVLARDVEQWKVVTKKIGLTPGQQ